VLGTLPLTSEYVFSIDNYLGIAEDLVLLESESFPDGVLRGLSGTLLGNSTTTNLPEGTNQYYTDARARAAISDSIVGITYTGSTGVLSLDTGYDIPTMAREAEWDAGITGSITDAVADGATKGVAAFAAADFNSASGVISLD